MFSSGGTERPHCVLIVRYREATLIVPSARGTERPPQLEVHIVFSSLGGTERPHCVLIWRYREATLIVPSARGTERPPQLQVQRGHLCWRH